MQGEFESNTTDINWSLNIVVPISQSAQFFGCVFFAHVSGMGAEPLCLREVVCVRLRIALEYPDSCL